MSAPTPIESAFQKLNTIALASGFIWKEREGAKHEWEKDLMCAACGQKTAGCSFEYPASSSWDQPWKDSFSYCTSCHPELPNMIEEFRGFIARHRQDVEAAARAKQVEDWRRARDQYIIKNIGEKFFGFTLDNFPAATPSQLHALDQMKKWVSGGFQRVPFAYIHGPKGSGKTSLLAGAYRALSELPHPSDQCWHMPTYATDGNLCQQWNESHASYNPRSGYDGPRPAEVLAEAIEAQYLLIDDFGRSTGSDKWGRAMFQIVNERMVHQRPTAFSSNFAPNELLARAYDEALVDRLSEGLVLRMDAPSMRGLSIAPTAAPAA